MKYYNYIFMLLFVGLAALTSCTQDDNIGNEGNPMQSFQIFVTDTGFDTGNATRAIENEYSTIFANGDAIGIFAVRNGSIVSDINNVKCTMVDGVWVMDAYIEYKESEFNTMSFYAYYPYSETFNSDTDFEASKTLTDGDPFEGYVANWRVEANQNETNYTKYDLMTSVGKASGQRLKGEVSFIMQHRMALAVLQMPELVYNFTNTDVTINDYALPTQAGTFRLNNQTATPYEQEIGSNTYYRFLVNPNREFTIAGSYIAGKEEKTYDHTATLTSGQAKLYRVKNPDPIRQLLSVGDYLCADGSIVTRDAAVPDNAVGVVFYVGNPQPSVTNSDRVTAENDALLRDYPSAVHGLVMALDNTQESGINMGGTALYHGFAEHYIGCNTGNGTLPTVTFPGCLGYNNTRLLSLFCEGGMPSGCTVAYSQITNYNTTVSVPTTASPWYLPNMQELNSIRDNMTVLNTAIGNIGGTQMEAYEATANGFYWSSNERNNNTQWIHRMQSDITGSWIRRDSGSSTGYYRLVLAF